MKVSYNIPIDTDEGVTLHVITIEGSAKKRKREMSKYIMAAYGINNLNKFARTLGFKDLA